jgi:hypothetical protein
MEGFPAMRGFNRALFALVALLAASYALCAAEPSPVWKDGWTINIPGESRWITDGTPSSLGYQGTPATAYTPGLAKDPYGYSDYSIGHSLNFGRDYGLGNMQATFGVRAADPLASSGFTPSFDPRRYMGVGPRLGLEGNSSLPASWAVEWKVGASMLYTDRSFDTAGVTNPVLPNFANTGSVLNIDGLLGLSYWFDSASKLTLGYHADYFKGTPTVNLTGSTADNADRLNHGPTIRFSIQK